MKPRVDWGEVILQHNRRVIVALLAQRVPVDRARDIAQETWAKLMEQHAHGALSELKFPGLAITQALFFARDEVRRLARRPAGVLADIADDQAPADAQLVTHEEAEAARAVLKTLSAKNRRVFQLAYEEDGLSHKEIGARVGLSEQRVRQILYEVRKALRQAVKEGV